MQRFEFEIEVNPVVDDQEVQFLFQRIIQLLDPELLQSAIGTETCSYFYRGVVVANIRDLRRMHVTLSAALLTKKLTTRWRYDGLVQWRDRYMFEYRDEIAPSN